MDPLVIYLIHPPSGPSAYSNRPPRPRRSVGLNIHGIGKFRPHPVVSPSVSSEILGFVDEDEPSERPTGAVNGIREFLPNVHRILRHHRDGESVPSGIDAILCAPHEDFQRLETPPIRVLDALKVLDGQYFAHRNGEEPELRDMGRELGNKINHGPQSVRLSRRESYQSEIPERFSKVRNYPGDQGFQIAIRRQIDGQMGQRPIHLRDVLHEAHRETYRLQSRKEYVRNQTLTIGERVWNDQLAKAWSRSETIDHLLANVHARPEPFEMRTGDLEEFFEFDPRLTINLQILQLGERPEYHGDDVLALAVVHCHHLSREGDRERTNPSGNVRIMNDSPSEGGNTPYRQINLCVQSASCFIAEELADQADLTESGEGLDQRDYVTVELQRETSACYDSGRNRSRGRSRGTFRRLG